MEPADYNGLARNVSVMVFHKGTVPQKEAENPMMLATSYMMYKIGDFSKCMVHFNSEIC